MPVYLDLSVGRVLIRASALDESRRRKLAKRIKADDMAPAHVEVTGVEKPSDAEGASRREKNRLTFFMRQALVGYWDEARETPEGEILDGVLLVHATRHARLEDMSFSEPSVWLRDHACSEGGVTYQHKADDPVGAAAAEWREALEDIHRQKSHRHI